MDWPKAMFKVFKAGDIFVASSVALGAFPIEGRFVTETIFLRSSSSSLFTKTTPSIDADLPPWPLVHIAIQHYRLGFPASQGE